MSDQSGGVTSAQAAKMRDLIGRIAEKKIDQKRPPESYATVTDIDRANNKAYVSVEGSDPIPANMEAVQPTMIGQKVRVSGEPGDQKVLGVIGEPLAKVRVQIKTVNTTPGVMQATADNLETGETGIIVDLTLASPGVLTVPVVGEEWWIENRAGSWALVGKVDAAALQGFASGDKVGPLQNVEDQAILAQATADNANTAAANSAQGYVVHQTWTGNSGTYGAASPGENSDFVLNNVSANSSRAYRVSLNSQFGVNIDNNTTWVAFNLKQGSSKVDRFHAMRPNPGANNDIYWVSTSCLWLPSTGTHDLRVSVEVSGIINAQFKASSSEPRRFWVEDIGPR